MIKDLVSKIDPDAINYLPDQVSTALDSLNGLVGLLNMILYAVDPALLALYHQLYMERAERRAQQHDDALDAEEAGAGQYPMYGYRPQSLGSQPSTPGLDAPQEYKQNHEDKVEVRSGKFLAPVRVGARSKRTTFSPMSPGPGIIIRVDVEIVDDLERLEDFLGGM